MKTLRFLSALTGLMIVAEVAAAADSGTWTDEQLKQYSRLQKLIDPKSGDVYQKVHKVFPQQKTYTDAQILAAMSPTRKKDKTYHPEQVQQKGCVPVDAFSVASTRELLSGYEQLNPAKKNLWQALTKKFGEQDWYNRAQIVDVEQNGTNAAKVDGERLPTDPVEKEVQLAETQPKPWWADFKSFAIRQSWRDVLYSEDPSQQAAQGKSLTDLVGATFSYAYNGKNNSDTWTAIGALIFPWEHDFKLTGGLTPARIALAPSVSIDRVETNAPAAQQTDSLLFRLGAYSQWLFATPRPSGFEVRAAAFYATDTDFRARLPAYEFDIEPHWQNSFFPLGYEKVLLWKQPLKDDLSDNTLLNYQLRVWLHTEGGDVQDDGKTWDTVKGSFFRVGPTVQFQLNAPELILHRDFSITALYSYSPAISGSSRHDSLFTITATYNIVKDTELNHKISLNIQYQTGGLDITKQDVDQFTVGLGVLF
ncbi:MAG: hypothetical protein WBZ19_01145 [Chthoniobacterales bacterium]